MQSIKLKVQWALREQTGGLYISGDKRQVCDVGTYNNVCLSCHSLDVTRDAFA